MCLWDDIGYHLHPKSHSRSCMYVTVSFRSDQHGAIEMFTYNYISDPALTSKWFINQCVCVCVCVCVCGAHGWNRPAS